MTSRHEYLHHGLSPVALPTATGSEMSYRAAATIQAAIVRVPEEYTQTGQRHILAAPIVRDMDTVLASEIARIAAITQPEIAPTITPDDMPHYLPLDRQKALYSDLLACGVSLSSVSRKAIAHELTPPQLYWDSLVRECVPIIESAIVRSMCCDTAVAAEAVDVLNRSIDFFEDQLTEDRAVMGRPDICCGIAATFLTGGIAYDSDDLETLLSHFIVHARIGNRHARHFDALIEGLPKQARRAAHALRDAGHSSEIVHLANDLLALERPALVERGQAQLTETAQILRQEMRDSNKLDVIRRPVLAMMAEDAASARDTSDAALMRQSEVSRDLSANYPVGGKKAQMEALAFQIAARLLAERERALDLLFNPSRPAA